MRGAGSVRKFFSKNKVSHWGRHWISTLDIHNIHMRHGTETQWEVEGETGKLFVQIILQSMNLVLAVSHYSILHEVIKLLREKWCFVHGLKVSIHNRLVNWLGPMVRQHMRARVYRRRNFVTSWPEWKEEGTETHKPLKHKPWWPYNFLLVTTHKMFCYSRVTLSLFSDALIQIKQLSTKIMNIFLQPPFYSKLSVCPIAISYCYSYYWTLFKKKKRPSLRILDLKQISLGNWK